MRPAPGLDISQHSRKKEIRTAMRPVDMARLWCSTFLRHGPGDGMAEHMLDSIDKALLNIIQGGFPLKAEPYEELGRMAGVSGDEALSRVRRLVEAGVVRKVGPFFDARKMGSASTLCAVHVPPENIEHVASVVNSRPEVTHNYQRDGVPNLWFTVIAPSKEAIGEVISDICERAGICRVHNIPASKMFKVKVDLKVE